MLIDESLAIRFKETFPRLSSKTNKIHDTKTERSRLKICLIIVSKSSVLCEYVHIYLINSDK